MGIQTMGSQGGGEGDGKRSQLQPIARQNSVYSLTLDEVQNQLADLGKPLSSMNLDELLKTVWTVEASQSMCVDNEGTAQATQASLPLSGALSKKTVDEVWRDIQENKDSGEKKSRERQPTLGEMTLEDFLAKAGIVAEASSNPTEVIDSNAVVPQFPPSQGHWIQYPQQQQQYQHPQQNLMGIYMPSQGMAQPLHMGPGASLDVPFADSQVALPSPLMGTLSDTQRKRGAPEEMVEKTVQRRHKRMIKNRESAARSRARKQAYTNELENKVSRLEEENERLRKQKELEKMLPCAPPPVDHIQDNTSDEIAQSLRMQSPVDPGPSSYSSMCFSHSLSNGNSSTSEPTSVAVKREELPSLQYSPEIDFGSWGTSPPPPLLESVDDFIQCPTPISTLESDCSSPQNSGLLDALLPQAKTLSSSKNHYYHKRSNREREREGELIFFGKPKYPPQRLWRLILRGTEIHLRS